MTAPDDTPRENGTPPAPESPADRRDAAPDTPENPPAPRLPATAAPADRRDAAPTTPDGPADRRDPALAASDGLAGPRDAAPAAPEGPAGPRDAAPAAPRDPRIPAPVADAVPPLPPRPSAAPPAPGPVPDTAGAAAAAATADGAGAGRGGSPAPVPAPRPRPGDLAPLLPADPSGIAGYRLLGRLGAGGMGVVYLGRTDAGELAAVKVTLADRAERADFRARFRREVEAARRVVSPWAVPVLGADPDAPEPWLATAFVPGPSLGEAIAAHGPLPGRSLRVLGGAVARALAAVHAAGLVHRDVKPGNVLLAVDGPRLIDFGIARAADPDGETALTGTDMVVGTPGFLAPEQAEARTGAIGPASDVFAFGCLLAYAATGRPPFGTGAVDALMYRTVHDEPDLAGVPAGLLPLLRECLAKDPAARPTAEQLAARLVVDTPGTAADWLPDPVVRTIAERSARMLALPDIDATTAGTPAPPPATSRRRFLLLASGAGVAAAGGAGWWALRGRDDRTDGKGAPPPKARRWTIGVQADLSGPGKEVGQAQERGVRLAVEAFNSRADKPFTLDVKVSDDRGDKTRALAAARVLTADPDVLGIIGPSHDYTGQEALPAYDEALLPVVTVSAGLNLLVNPVQKQGRSVLQACPIHAFNGMHIAYHAQAVHRPSRPGLLQERTDDPYSWQFVLGAKFGFQQGGVLPHPRVIPSGAKQLERVVGEMVDAGIDAYVHAGLLPSAVRAAKALDALGFTGPRYAGQHVLGDRFPRDAGRAAEGWTVGAPAADPTSRKEAAAFLAAHRARYGAAAPVWYAGEAYDVTLFLAQQVEKAYGKAGRRPDRTTLAPLLRKAVHQGVMGGYSFDENGNLKGVGTFLHRVEDGRYRSLGAAPATPAKKAGG